MRMGSPADALLAGFYVLYRTVKCSKFRYRGICLFRHFVIHSRRGIKMNILISLIVYLVIFGLIWWLVSLLPLPAPVAQIVRVLFIILLILIVLSVFGIIPGGYLPKLNL
jgi:hypothetical protein